MIINNTSSFILIFYSKIFNNYFLFEWKHYIASYEQSHLNDEENWLKQADVSSYASYMEEFPEDIAL